MRERLGKKYDGSVSSVIDAALKRVKALQSKRRRDNRINRQVEDAKRNKTSEQMTIG